MSAPLLLPGGGLRLELYLTIIVLNCTDLAVQAPMLAGFSRRPSSRRRAAGTVCSWISRSDPPPLMDRMEIIRIAGFAI
jgi:hypothetical protein